MNVLEGLQQIEQNLVDPTQLYEFREWVACTCGHVFAVATGTTVAENRERSRSTLGQEMEMDNKILYGWAEDKEYENLLTAIVDANSLRCDDDERTPSIIVSDATLRRARGGRPGATGATEAELRRAALELVRKAIHEEQAKVRAQMAELAEPVDMPEPVYATSADWVVVS